MAGFLVDVFGFDPFVARITQFVLAFLVVVAAIFIGLWGFSRLTRRLRGDDDFGPSRLRVVDVVSVDEKRRLILIRRDDVEHLVLVGGPTDIVVESGIRRVAPARPQPARPAEPSVAPRPAAVAPEPAGQSRQEPPIDPFEPAEPHPPRREPPPIDPVRPPRG